MPTLKAKRKRPYRTHEFGQVLAGELAGLGDSGHVKVLLPDGLTMHRIVGLTPTLEDDLIVTLEEAPCWRKRGTGLESLPLWRPVIAGIAKDVIVTEEGTPNFAVAIWDTVNKVWYDYAGNKVYFTPTHFAELPPLPGAAK